MEAILLQILAYLISLAAGMRGEAIVEKRRNRLAEELEKNKRDLGAISNRASLRDHIKKIGARAGRHMAALQVEDPIERSLWKLLAEPIFAEDLTQWLTLWDLSEAQEAKSRLEDQIANSLKSAGAGAARIRSFREDFFNLVDNLVFEDSKLAEWRHHLGLQSLHEGQAEMLLKIREQSGEYSADRIREALKEYRRLSLKISDIIDLAGLPEDDRHLAMQDFVLRQLYIPLRVNLEVPRKPMEIGGEGEKSEDDYLADLEARRESKRLELAGRGNLGEKKEEKSGDRISVGEILNSNNRAVILGDPGGGKTTLLRWLATAYLLRLKKDPQLKDLPDVATLPDIDFLPILVRCRDLPSDAHRCDFDDILNQALISAEIPSKLRPAVLAGLRLHLEDGSALLLVDGLDEIQDPMLRARFCRRLEGIAVIYDKARILVTSRIVGYREMRFRMGRGFVHGTISELTPEEMDEFARRWIEATESRKTEGQRRDLTTKLTADIHSSERIERLAGNPMLLTTLALVHRKVGRLPQRRVDLYREAVQVLLNWRREIDEPLDWLEAVPQLEYIAYAMCKRGTQRLTRHEVLTLIEEMREKYSKWLRPIANRSPEDFLALLENRSSILVEAGNTVEDGHEVPVYEFRHLTIQEYLAALALVEGRFPGHVKGNPLSQRVAPLAGIIEGPKRKSPRWRDAAVSENWREPLRLCTASCHDDDVDDTILAILRVRTGEKSKRLSRPRAVMAALCLADEPSVSEDIALTVISALCHQIREGDGDGDVTTTFDLAVHELGRSVWKIGVRKALFQEFCERGPEDNDALSVGSAIATLGLLDVPGDKKRLRDWISRIVAQLDAEEELESTEAALIIMRLAFRKKIRTRLPGMIDSLLRLLDRGPSVCLAAVWALGWLGGATRRRRVWNPTEDEVTRLLALGEVTDLLSATARWLIIIFGRCKDIRLGHFFTKYLMHKNEGVRRTAVQSLSKFRRLKGQKLKLLSQEFVDFGDCIDPNESIDHQSVAAAAHKLKLSEKRVMEHYEELAPTFKLTLAWKTESKSKSASRKRSPRKK